MLGVVAGAPLLTAVSGRFARKHLLLAMMMIFTVGNLAAAAAPSVDQRALKVFAAKTEAECALLSAMSPAGQRRVNDELRTVLLALEGLT